MRKTLISTGLIGLLLVGQTALAAAPAPAVADAAEKGNSAAVLALIKRGADINVPQADGGTALHWAAHWDDLMLAKKLLAAGARVNAANDYGVTPLFLAASNGNAAMLSVLLEAGGQANAALPSGETVLMSAVRSGRADAVRRLLAAGANPNTTQISKAQTALMWAIADDKVDVAKALLEGGADVHATSGAGSTPLMFAARTGDIEMTRLLLAAGDAMEASSKDGSTPLLISTVKGNAALSLFLLDQGANPEGNVKQAGYTPLMWAAASFDPIPMTYKGVDVDGEWASFPGIPDRALKIKLIKALLARGADINRKSTKGLPEMTPFNGAGNRPPHVGATPFIIAAQSADAEIMTLLLANGADPSIRPNDGQTALMAACEGIMENTLYHTQDLRIAAAQVALDAGVPLEGEDNKGYRAMHVAARGGYHDVIKFLLAKGAEKDPVSKATVGGLGGNTKVAGQSPLGLVEGTVDSIFYERPDTAVFLRGLGFKSVGRFSTAEFENGVPQSNAAAPGAKR